MVLYVVCLKSYLIVLPRMGHVGQIAKTVHHATNHRKFEPSDLASFLKSTHAFNRKGLLDGATELLKA